MRAGIRKKRSPSRSTRKAGIQTLSHPATPLLSDKLVTAQWWDEDQSDDGFYTAMGHQALSYYTLQDGRVVGIWKSGYTTITDDKGKTWKPAGLAKDLPRNNAKYWAQRTDDGRYALVFNPTNRLRHRASSRYQ